MKKATLIILITLIISEVNAQVNIEKFVWGSSRNINGIDVDSNGNFWCGGPAVQVFDGNNWIKSYNNLNGIVSNYIDDLKIDKKGNVWVATIYGVSVFDGIAWTTYDTSNGLSSLPVNEIEVDSAGNVWFAEDSGVTMYDGSNWTTYNYSNTNGIMPPYRIESIFEDSKGHLWFGTHDQSPDYYLVEFDGVNWIGHETKCNPYSITEDDDGDMWIGGIGPWTGCISTNKYGKWDKIESFKCGSLVRDIEFDSEGKLWVGAHGYTTFVYDGNEWVEYDFETYSGWPAHGVSKLVPDSNAGMWLGMGNGTLMHVTKDTTTTKPTSVKSYNDDYHLSIYPNPSKGDFRIDLGASKVDKTNIQIFTEMGSVYDGWSYLNSQDPNSLEIGIEDQGIYFLVIELSEQTITRRLVVESK